VRILLDNCVNALLAASFEPHHVVHVAQRGWAEVKNGELVRLAAAEFDVLVTVDKAMRFETSLRGVDLAVVVLDVRSNLLNSLQAAVQELLPQLLTLPIGEFTVIQPGQV
jgi:predicted nuclease of predicted toxin-antitoxin system